jgi:hypothetical protein
MVALQPLIQPYLAAEANAVELCSLVILSLLSSFNVASLSRISGNVGCVLCCIVSCHCFHVFWSCLFGQGGADPRNDILDAITVALLFVPFIIGGLAWMYHRCVTVSTTSKPPSEAPPMDTVTTRLLLHHSGDEKRQPVSATFSISQHHPTTITNTHDITIATSALSTSNTE